MVFEDYKTLSTLQKERLARAKEMSKLMEQIVRDSEHIVSRVEQLEKIAQILIDEID